MSHVVSSRELSISETRESALTLHSPTDTYVSLGGLTNQQLHYASQRGVFPEQLYLQTAIGPSRCRLLQFLLCLERDRLQNPLETAVDFYFAVLPIHVTTTTWMWIAATGVGLVYRLRFQGSTTTVVASFIQGRPSVLSSRLRTIPNTAEVIMKNHSGCRVGSAITIGIGPPILGFGDG